VTAAAGFALLAVTLVSVLGAATWLGELTTHFRPFLAAASLLLVAWALARRAWVGLAASGVALLLNAMPLWPYVADTEGAGRGAPIRVLTLNLWGGRADYAAVEALILRERPDLAVLTEPGPALEPMLERLRAVLPTQLRPERSGSFETIILSAWEARNYAVDRRSGPAFPVTRLRLCRETCVEIVALHATRPLGETADYRAQQLAVAAELAAAASGRTVLLGDLNCTPWSPAFDQLLLRTGLRDSGLGRGLPTTWPAGIPFIGLAIDHVLVGDEIGVADRRVGPGVGSDHYPVIADLVLRAQ
jgi:endonuclease/exonuclease/phosphatase (EEP) superfamily protein YafD